MLWLIETEDSFEHFKGQDKELIEFLGELIRHGRKIKGVYCKCDFDEIIKMQERKYGGEKNEQKRQKGK